MNMKQLMTKWADNINEKNVLGEYARPLMRRRKESVDRKSKRLFGDLLL